MIEKLEKLEFRNNDSVFLIYSLENVCTLAGKIYNIYIVQTRRIHVHTFYDLVSL